LHSEVVFGSFLAYSPRGTSETSRQSRLLCHRIKADGVIGNPPVRAIEYTVGRFRDQYHPGPLYDLVGADVTLVPCPRSAPFPPGRRPVLWVPMRICEALKAAGFGSAVLPLLERKKAVQKSAFAGPGRRPGPQEQLESLQIAPGFEHPGRITVVDDVVTKGATLLAATFLVADSFPDADVRAFALVRTMGLIPDVNALVDPVVGRIARTPSGGVDRQP
jgi:hypothetical protein